MLRWPASRRDDERMLSDTPVFPSHPPTLPELIADWARRYGPRDMVADSRGVYSYEEVDLQARRLARRLLASGAGKGTRIGLLMPNCLDWVVAFLAIGRIGAICFPISTLFQAKELGWLLKRADIDTLLASPAYAGKDFVALLEEAVPALKSIRTTTFIAKSHPFLRRVFVFGPVDRAWASSPSTTGLDSPTVGDDDLKRVEAEVSPADLLIGICTSGSTAEPKIVMHTHGSAVRTTHAYRPYVDVRPDDRHYCGMPFFWIAGVNYNLLSTLYEGACLVFSDTPRPADVVRIMSEQRVTTTRLWLPQQLPLREWVKQQNITLPHLRRGLGADRDETGEVIPPSRKMGGALGMTECFGPHSVGITTGPVPERLAGYWGHELVGVERKIVEPSSGAEIKDGRVGELYIRGFSMMDGYYKQGRHEVFEPDGFFKTGDLCRITPEGALYFEGRGNEMIKTSGANVSPREVELALQAQPGIQEAVVFGIPDQVKGEIVAATIVASAGCTVDVARLRDGMKSAISSYKVPAAFLVLRDDEVPRTGSGKAVKGRLREILLRRLPAQGNLSARSA